MLEIEKKGAYMSIFPAIETYLALQGHKYISPDKAGELRETMLDVKQKGQTARTEFSDLVKQFQTSYPKLTLERTSNWMNQSQILRPHFWNYLCGYGDITEPMFALRLYGKPRDFGVSLEVSFIERKKDETSLTKQKSSFAGANRNSSLLLGSNKWCQSTICWDRRKSAVFEPASKNRASP